MATDQNKIKNNKRRDQRIVKTEETTSITEVTEKRQLKWFGRSCRMNHTRFPKTVYEWELEGEKTKRTTNAMETEHTSDYKKS